VLVDVIGDLERRIVDPVRQIEPEWDWHHPPPERWNQMQP
jgi:hypothetical protein